MLNFIHFIQKVYNIKHKSLSHFQPKQTTPISKLNRQIFKERRRRKKPSRRKYLQIECRPVHFNQCLWRVVLTFRIKIKILHSSNTHSTAMHTHMTYVYIFDISFDSPIEISKSNPIGMFHWTEIYSLLIQSNTNTIWIVKFVFFFSYSLFFTFSTRFLAYIYHCRWSVVGENVWHMSIGNKWHAHIYRNSCCYVPFTIYTVHTIKQSFKMFVKYCDRSHFNAIIRFIDQFIYFCFWRWWKWLSCNRMDFRSIFHTFIFIINVQKIFFFTYSWLIYYCCPPISLFYIKWIDKIKNNKLFGKN